MEKEDEGENEKENRKWLAAELSEISFPLSDRSLSLFIFFFYLKKKKKKIKCKKTEAIAKTTMLQFTQQSMRKKKTRRKVAK